MTTAAELAVIVPTRSRWEILRRTLDALHGQTVSGFEVIVVVDGIDQHPPPGLPATRVIKQEHAGPAVARNRGVDETGRDLVLFLGDDMIPTPRLVERHLEWHERHPEESVAVLGHVDWHPEVRKSRILRWLDWSTTQFDYRHLVDRAGEDVGFARFYSCNVSLKRALFDRVGGFDADFLFYYEDLDIGYRLGEAGMKLVYEPAARTEHLHHYDFESLQRRFEGIALGERLMADKHAWFQPYFHERINAAVSRPRVRRWWPVLVDVVPAGSRLRRRAERQANTWYHQQVADGFLRSWERAADVVELRRYLGERFEARLIAHAAEAVEREAEAIGDEETFYRRSEAYLYDLTVFAMSGTKAPYRDELARHVGRGARLLDYGCGIGSDGLALISAGYDVAFADFRNPSTAYLRWRLRERGLEAPVYDLDSDDIPGGYDAVYAFDVIEHVDDPFALLERLERLGRLVVVNLLEDDPHDHEHALHRTLPIPEIVDHAERRGLVSRTVHHGRSHLLVYRGAA